MSEPIRPSKTGSPQRTIQVSAPAPAPLQADKALKKSALLGALTQGLDNGLVLGQAAPKRPSALTAAGPVPPPSAAPSSSSRLFSSSSDSIADFYRSMVGLTGGLVNGQDFNGLVDKLLDAIKNCDAGSSNKDVADAIHSLISSGSDGTPNSPAVSLAFMVIFKFKYEDLVSGSWISQLPSSMQQYLEPQKNAIQDWVQTTFGKADAFEAKKASLQPACMSAFLLDISMPGATLGSVSMAQLRAELEGSTNAFSGQSFTGLIDYANQILGPVSVRGSILGQMDTMAAGITNLLKQIIPPTPDSSKPATIDGYWLDPTHKQPDDMSQFNPVYEWNITWPIPAGVKPPPGVDPGTFQNQYNDKCWQSLSRLLTTIYNATAPIPGPMGGQASSIGNHSFTFEWPPMSGKEVTIPPIASFFPADAQNATDTAKLQASLTDFHNALGNIQIYDSAQNTEDPKTGKPNTVALSELFAEANKGDIDDLVKNGGLDRLTGNLQFTMQAAEQRNVGTDSSTHTFETDAVASRAASALTGLIPTLTSFSSSAQNAVQTAVSASQSAWQQYMANLQSMLTTQNQIMNSIAAAMKNA